jgi:hypothetical protein
MVCMIRYGWFRERVDENQYEITVRQAQAS